MLCITKITLFFVCMTSCNGVSYNDSSVSPFRQTIVLDDVVYIGASGGIVALHRENLSVIQTKKVYSNNWLLLNDSSRDQVIQCNEDSTKTSRCRKLNSSLEFSGIMSSNMTVNITNLPSYTHVRVPQVDADVAIIAATSLQLLNNTYGIVSLNLTTLHLFLPQQNQRGPMNIELGKNYDLVFKSTFRWSNYVYFFFQVWFKNGNFSTSKIGKLCINNTTAKNMSSGFYHSYEDMTLKCKGFTQLQFQYFTEEYVLAVFSKDNSSAVCRFDWATIKTKFRESRKESLKCGQNTTNKDSYFIPKVNLGKGGHENCFNENGTCMKAVKICGELNGDFCNTEIHHTVIGGTGIENEEPVYVVDKVITALDIVRLNNDSILYVGTDGGEIATVSIDIDSRSNPEKEYIKYYRVDTTKVVHIKAEQSYIYVMTEETVTNMYIANCASHQNCESCMMSRNPYCGWDYKNRKCHSNGTDWWWSPSAVGFCIKISGLENEIEIAPEFHFSVTLPPKVRYATEDKSLTCHISNSNGTVKNDVSNCGINLDRPKLDPGRHTFTLKLDGVILAEESIILYRCTQFNTCKDCTSRPNCRWNWKCSKEGTIYTEDDCPTLNMTGYPILIKEKEHPINFTLNLLKFGTINDEKTKSMFMCEVTIQNKTAQSLGVQFYTMESAACIGLQLNATEEHGPTQYMIRLKLNTSYVDNEAILNVYNCSKLLTDRGNCFECQDFIKSGYNCKWCQSEDKCYDSGYQTCSDTTSYTNCTIEITKVLPTSGPINGGTLVTITGQNIGSEIDNISVTIDGVDCTDVDVLNVYRQITCKTGKKDNSNGYKNIISLSVNGMKSSYHVPFIYKKPTLTDFRPNKGIAAGNTTITITGTNITFEGTHRYYVVFCNGTTCIECSLFDNNTKEGKITCKTGNVTAPQEMNILHVRIDELTNLTLNKSFRYFPDPSGINLSNGTTDVINSGGSKITINGEGFSNVGSVTVDDVDEPCDVPTDTTVVCETPRKKPTEDRNQTIRVHFDGLTVEINVNYVDDPAFDVFNGILEYDKESTIQITGSNMLRGVRKDDYSIQIGLDGRCFVIDITMTTITCYPPKTVPRTNHSDANIVFVVIKVGSIRKYIGDLNYKVEVEILAIVVGVLSAALVIAVVVGLLAVLILKKKKKKAIKEFKLELVSREDMIRKASREEFADAQMSIRDIKTDLVTSRVPYCSYQKYIFRQLFPNQEMDTHSLLRESTITDDRKSTIQSAMDKLDKLLTNKLFLKSLVQTLDRQYKLTIQEKAHFASVLSIALLGNMRLFYDLISCLLTDMIESSSKKQQKVLFRRFESITQRLTANWLQLTLYEQLKSQIGIPLFMLYKAVQTITEKAPIDAITGNSKNTLAEEKLLKMRIEYETLTLHIDLNGNSDQSYPVKVLDCDTISQVKRKCCLQIYRNKPVSEIPENNELILEWQHGKGGKHVLDDIDTISERGNGLVRLNTLKHYMVKDNSRMILMYKENEDTNEIYENSENYKRESATTDDINLLIPEGEEGQTSDEIKWHLECSTSNLPDDVKSNREQDIGDIFLNRLFHTKLLLTDYIDTAFEDLIDHKSLSVPMGYFLCMLDKLGKDFEVESDVLQIWKSECYGTRVWGPLIGSPQIIFEIDVPCHVEPCLDILRQVFVESFTQIPHKVSKESPPQKLLFHKDIPRYRNLIAPVFKLVESVSDQEFWSAMEELSQYQKQELGFSRQGTLCMIYNLFIGKYKREIIDGFQETEASNDLEFANKLEEIIELMEEP